MPTTIYPSKKPAETCGSRVGTPSPFSTAQAIFEESYEAVNGEEGRIQSVQLFSSSFSNEEPWDPDVVPVSNGFVHTLMQAYNQHRMLIIRPDDVWMAILTQFSYFVNANAESLRGSFVAHEGKKNLHVDLDDHGRLDVSYVASCMTNLLHENITDPSIREWIMPNFSTTTDLDETTVAIIMMSTFQKYFTYSCGETCGIPSVTLEGKKSDWQSLLRRIEKLKEYGPQTTTWYHLLRPILRHFVAGFDNPSDSSLLDFWNKVMHAREFCGGGILTGWITAFCVFDREGQWRGPDLTKSQKVQHTEEDAHSSARHFWSKFLHPLSPQQKAERLEYDGAIYPAIDLYNIPPAVVGVPLKVIGCGAPNSNGALLAGLCAYHITSSKDLKHSRTGERDTIQPMAGWWLYFKDEEKRQEIIAAEKAEEKRLMEEIMGKYSHLFGSNS